MSTPQWLFEPFRLDPVNACLWRGTESVALPPKAFDVLHYLVMHPNRLVTKDELLDAVWPATAISDAVVRVAIGALRRALDDTAQTPRYIATVARRGYRFLAAVTVVDPPEPAGTEGPPQPTVPSAPQPPAVPPALAVLGPQDGVETRRCVVCQHLQSRTARFCVVCGAPGAATCPACGQVVPLLATFCPACGQRLGTATDTPRVPAVEPQPVSIQARAPQVSTPVALAVPHHTSRTTLEGERKQMTVLFADITDSLALIRNLDPEAAQQFLDPAVHRMMDAVHRYEGTVNQMLGDGIMALFGAPIAYEDHALRACYAALAMQATLRAYAEEVHRTHGVALHIRVGLNSGEVVVRTMPYALQMEYSAVGQTTHLAARMEQVATPGTIVLTAATARLVEGLVRIKALGPVPVKGLVEPLDVYELLGASALQGRFLAAVARGLTRFVGREAALDSVRQALERARAGHGQVVAVVGEAGMGKSRLVYECLHALDMQGWLVLESAALSYTQATPYFPVVTLLKRYFRIEDGETPQTIQATITAQVRGLDAILQETVPALLALLDALPDDDPFRQLDPAQRRSRILDALKRLLVRASQTQPVVLVVEDLHWLDTETQTWLDRLVDSLPAVPLLLLVNYRPEYQHSWSSKTYYTHLRLDPLPPASTTALVQEFLGDDASLAPLVPLLIAHTEGNPFFLEESLRTLVETQALIGTRGAYRLVQALPTIQVPATVQAVLAARIDRLPPNDKRLLQTAAVIGMDVPLSMLHAVTDLPESAVQHGLADLQAAELLYETHLFPEVIYTFKHALTRQVAAQSLLRSARQEVHRQIAQVLETRFATLAEVQPERLAHHYTEAGHGAPAVVYWQRAGQRAMERSAPVEAISHLTRGLEVLTTMPETPEHIQQELDLQILLGAARTQTRGWAAPEVAQVYARARELCQGLGASPQLLAVLLEQVVGSLQRAELQTAEELATHLLAIAQQHGDPIFLLAAHTTLGVTLFLRGEMATAHLHLVQGNTLYVPTSHHTLIVHHSFDLGVVVRCYAALSLWLLGTPEQALAQMHEARALAQELSHPYNLAFALAFMTRLYQLRRDVPATLTWTERLIAICVEHGFEQYLSWARLLHGWALAAQGQGDEGLDQMTRGLTAYEATGSAISRPYFLALLAEGYGQVGAADEGLRVLAEALAAVQHTGEHMWEAELHRLMGKLRLQARLQHPAPGNDLLHTAEAEACLHRALAVARRQQAKSLELRAAMSLSRLWRRLGKRTEAYALLAPVYGWFTEGFDTADLQDARALLEALG
jgi:class 3 adenylate cyclase/DNA-binding winged helix-turn-helix (wHTH) protein/predicted ATPase